MMNSEDILQERLARLEAGEPLEAVLTGLPEAEAGLVRMAASLRVVSQAAYPEDRVVAQRRQLLRAAQANAENRPRRVGWAWPMALAGVATVFVCALLTVGLAGATWWWLRSPASVAQNSTSVPTVKSTPDPTAVVQADDPQSAVLTEARGLVEVQDAEGRWLRVQVGHTVRAGQRLRTGTLSSVTLSFYDGSRAFLGPDTEVSIDALDAQKSGSRVILLTQWLGESSHSVAESGDPASRYEVRTPSGTGSAKGTTFHVLVTLAQMVYFDVGEGLVEVTNLGTTVAVVAGQSTTILAGQAPQSPVFRIEGEGEVEQIGNVWVIAGYTFLTDASTVIVGDPQVGDWVAFKGHLLPDGTRFADRIELVQRSPENRFAFIGDVQAIQETQWTIAGRVVRVDNVTRIEPGIVVGDEVEVRGGIADDGTLWATTIERAVPNGFRFTGVVETIGDGAWMVSGISVTVGISTTVEPGIEVGDRVLVVGQVLDDGTWQATAIRRVEADTFDFVGVVISTDPWVIDGIRIRTDERTRIDEGIDIGNRVRVRGRVLADGTWLAESIEQLDEGSRHHVEFTARVRSIDPWMVGAVAVTVDDKTKIIGDIEVGDWVTVKGQLLPDGTVIAKKITRLHREQGCLTISTVVKMVDANRLVMFDGRAVELGETIEIEGEIKVASVIVVHVCVDEADEVHLVRIVVVFQLDEVPVVIVPPSEGDGDRRDCKDGPGRGLGHCKHDDNHDKHDDDDDD